MFRKLLTSLALALVFAAGAARAQTAEAEARGRQIAHSLIEAVDFDKAVIQSAKQSMGGTVDFGVKSRPEWSHYLVDALSEEVQHNGTLFEGLLGHALAKTLTEPELKAGVVIVADRAFQAKMAQDAGGAAPSTLAPSRDTERVIRTPAGKAFLSRLEKLDAVINPLIDDFAAAIMPGMLRRFADKVEAGERARQAGAS